MIAVQISVFTALGPGPEERLDFWVLFDRFKKQFKLPAVLVDCRDGCRHKFGIVRQKNCRFLLILKPYFHEPEEVLVARPGFAMKENDLVFQNISFPAHGPVFDDFEGSIVLDPGGKIDALLRYLDDPFVIDVGVLHDENSSRIKTNSTIDINVAPLAVYADYK